MQPVQCMYGLRCVVRINNLSTINCFWIVYPCGFYFLVLSILLPCTVYQVIRFLSPLWNIICVATTNTGAVLDSSKVIALDHPSEELLVPARIVNSSPDHQQRPSWPQLYPTPTTTPYGNPGYGWALATHNSYNYDQSFLPRTIVILHC